MHNELKKLRGTVVIPVKHQFAYFRFTCFYPYMQIVNASLHTINNGKEEF